MIYFLKKINTRSSGTVTTVVAAICKCTVAPSSLENEPLRPLVINRISSSVIKFGHTYEFHAPISLSTTRNTIPTEYAEIGYFVGISALPTDGSPDTAMQAFMEDVRNARVLDDDSIVYRVGDTAFAYEDKNKGELVIWDRATETKQTIACGAVINDRIGCLSWVQDRKYEPACFQANTAEGTYYIGYEEENPTKAWSEYSATPFEKEEQLDAYYELLCNKLNG